MYSFNGFHINYKAINILICVTNYYFKILASVI